VFLHTEVLVPFFAGPSPRLNLILLTKMHGTWNLYLVKTQRLPSSHGPRTGLPIRPLYPSNQALFTFLFSPLHFSQTPSVSWSDAFPQTLHLVSLNSSLGIQSPIRNSHLSVLNAPKDGIGN